MRTERKKARRGSNGCRGSMTRRRGREGAVRVLSLRRIEADATRASGVRRGDAPAIDGRESRPPRRDLWAPETRSLGLLAGSVQRKRVVDARSSAFGDARSRNVAPKRGRSWDRDASERRYRRTSLRRRVGVCVSAARRASREFVHGDAALALFHLRLCCALAGSACRVFLVPRVTGRAAQKIIIPVTSQSEWASSGARRPTTDARRWF